MGCIEFSGRTICAASYLRVMDDSSSVVSLPALLDLRQRIYRKGKAEAVGWGGVDAGEKSGSNAPPTSYVS